MMWHHEVSLCLIISLLGISIGQLPPDPNNANMDNNIPQNEQINGHPVVGLHNQVLSIKNKVNQLDGQAVPGARLNSQVDLHAVNNQPVHINAGDPQVIQQRVSQPNLALSQDKQPANAFKSTRQRNTGIIADSEECAADAARICGARKRNLNNNFEVLYCLTNDRNNEDLSPECHQYIWSYKMNATKNEKFHTIARELCKEPLKLLDDCNTIKVTDGKLISCLWDNRAQINVPTCSNFLTKIRTIVFSDYRLICDFVDDCGFDIKRYTCGSADADINTPPQAQHSQGQVVSCLQEVLESGQPVNPKCHEQILKLAELSADDYHMDRNLYFKCRADRERLCGEIEAGEGRVYKCLFNHKSDQQMSHDCRDALTIRQKLVAIDYKASYSILKSCQEDIEATRCNQHGHSDENDVAGLSSIMLCLENQNIQGVPISPECDDQLIDFRRMLMEDYSLSPEITHNCVTEIKTKCGGNVEKEGGTLHCLLAQAQEKDGLSQNCQNAMMDLIKETEVAQDYRMDAVLTRACGPVIQSQCSNYQDGDPMILSCLMENLQSKQMNKNCRDRLLEIQYFISRDFFIDPVFRDKCKADADRLCFTPLHAGNSENDENDDSEVMPFGLVMSCLYRQIEPPIGKVRGEISPGCEEEVHRILHERALDFGLNPELERKCRTDLASLCSDEIHEKGSELLCLQDHYDDISDRDCREELQELTQLESREVEDVENILITACEPMLQQYCSDLLQDDDEGRIMQCLIENKDIMESAKCAAGVTHFQLIEMKDYHFSYRFLKSCKADVDHHCKGEDIKTKADVVKCLSQEVRDEVLKERPPANPVSQQCRDQLTVENLQMHKNIDLNPELKKSCMNDYQRFCSTVKAGKAQVIECLRERKNELSRECYNTLFQLEKDESLNPKLDFQLMRSCKSDIKQHCMADLVNGDPQHIVECLLKKKSSLVKSCRQIIIQREMEMFSDIDLNVDLQNSCGKDIIKLCSEAKLEAKAAHQRGEDPHGVIYSCLKDKFTSASKENRLSQSCYHHVVFVMKEQEQNYRLDPQLTLHCIKSISKLCQPDSGINVVECLKEQYFQGNLMDDQPCMVEIARLLQEGRSDIMADPIFYQSCANDLASYCSDIPEGKGRLITCLIRVSNGGSSKLSPPCKDQLDARREMWDVAIKVKVGSVGDLQRLVMESENSSHILAVLTLMAVGLLVLGTMCGRVTKRITRERKMR